MGDLYLGDLVRSRPPDGITALFALIYDYHSHTAAILEPAIENDNL